MVHDDYFPLYRKWLGIMEDAENAETASEIAEATEEAIESTASYQDDAKVNGTTTPLSVTRTGVNTCDVIVPSGSSLYIGDLVYVYDENWLCMEAYTDEYGVRYAVIWLCNHILRFQTHSLKIVEKPMILDDGSYSSPSEKSIVVSDSKYDCYVSLDDESRDLFIDKRFALDIVLNSGGEETLLVDKIVWLDAKTKNLGKGSHLLAFNVESDVYNPTTDSIEQRICDYIETDDAEEDETQSESGGDTTQITEGDIVISGRSALRIGTTRTYAAEISTLEDLSAINFEWQMDEDIDGIELAYDGATATISIALDDDLAGETFTLTCIDTEGIYASGSKVVEVVSNG